MPVVLLAALLLPACGGSRDHAPGAAPRPEVRPPEPKVPTIASAEPPTAKAGQRVTIRGANLAEVSEVLFGSLRVKPVKVSPDAVEVVVPDGATPAPVILVTPTRQVPLEGKLTVTDAKPPQDPPKGPPKDPPKDSPKGPPKDPPKGPPKDDPKGPPKDPPKDPLPLPPHLATLDKASGHPGTVLTLGGTHLHPITELLFEGVTIPPGDYSVDKGGAWIKVKAPAWPSQGRFTARRGTLATLCPAVFTLTYPAPKVTGLSAPGAQPGQEVTLTGTDFRKVQGVAFGTTPLAPGDYLVEPDGTRIRVKVPDGPPPAGSFTVTTAYGGPAASGPFTIHYPAPRIGTVTVSLTRIELTGTWLGSAHQARFPRSGGFLDVAPTSAATGHVVLPIPAGARPGQVRLTTRGGHVDFRFSPRPAVTAINPTTAAGGEIVEITGTGLFRSLAPHVKVGGVWVDAKSTLVLADGTRIRFPVPAEAVSGQVVTVVTTAGSQDSAEPLVIPCQAPRIDHMDTGPGVPGTEVAFDGEHLGGVTGVAFGGQALPAGTWWVDQLDRLHAQVPLDAAAGDARFTLRDRDGHAVDSDLFTVRILPSRAALLGENLRHGDTLDYPSVSRTEQYGYGWPKAPLLHAYHPGLDSSLRDPVHGFQAQVPAHFRLPSALFREVLPQALRNEIAHTPAHLLEIHVVVQDQPYLQPLFRPHYWLYPDTRLEGVDTVSRQAGLGLFDAPGAVHPVQLHELAGGGSLLTGGPSTTSVHPQGDHPGLPQGMVSSGPNLPVDHLDGLATKAFWSLVQDVADPVRPGRTAATLHLVLKDDDFEAFETLMGRRVPAGGIAPPAIATFEELLDRLHADAHLRASPATRALLDLVRPRITGAVLGAADPTTGEQEVTLTGTGLLFARRVRVDGVRCTHLNRVSDTELRARVAGLAVAPTHAYKVVLKPYLSGTATH